MKEVLAATGGIILFLIGMIQLSSAVREMMNARIKDFCCFRRIKSDYTRLFSVFMDDAGCKNCHKGSGGKTD